MLASRSVPASIRASRVLTGALAGQFTLYARRPRPFQLKTWPARAPATAREGARTPQKGRTVSRCASHVIPFLLAGLLAGCTVGPDYHPPKTAAPAQWASPQEGGETNLPAADAAWWKSFHDAELDSLVVRAAQSNLNLRAAVARVREARAAAGVVSAGLFADAGRRRLLRARALQRQRISPVPARRAGGGRRVSGRFRRGVGTGCLWRHPPRRRSRPGRSGRGGIWPAQCAGHDHRRSGPPLRRRPRLPAASGRGRSQPPGPGGNPGLDPRPVRQGIDRRTGRAGSRRAPGRDPGANAGV